MKVKRKSPAVITNVLSGHLIKKMEEWIQRHWKRAITIVCTATIHGKKRTVRMLVGFATATHVAGQVDGFIEVFKWADIELEEAATDDGFKFSNLAAI